MLKRIEIWNFESHEHTVLDDLSEGLNLMCGESNSGKTSIVRAVKLAAYNVFDPACVRVGKKTCKVLVESDRGLVIVERGKKVNKWEVTPKGGKKEEFDKVGVAIVPKAAEIIGLKMVKLGDVEVPVNIMDQLESHFMLSGIAGDKASGSMRAQVVDEISGLSGIEGVIKDVSLDRHRFGREVKRTEDEMNATSSKLHDDDRIAKDEATIDDAQKLLDDNDECISLASDFEKTHEEYVSVSKDISDLESGMAKLPDHERASKGASKAESMITKSVAAEKTYEESKSVSEEIKLLEDKESELNKFGDPSSHLEKCQSSLKKSENASRIHEDYTDTAKEVESREKWLSGLGDPSDAINEAIVVLDKAEKASVLLVEAGDAKALVQDLEGDLVEMEKEATEVATEMEKILSDVKVCPLTLGPVSEKCVKEAKAAL